jgi:hypothetical protein
MRKTIWSIVLLGVLCISACGPVPGQNYHGSVHVFRSNGKIAYVETQFPGSSYKTTIKNKESATNLINHLEQIVKDMKVARDEME